MSLYIPSTSIKGLTEGEYSQWVFIADLAAQSGVSPVYGGGIIIDEINQLVYTYQLQHILHIYYFNGKAQTVQLPFGAVGAGEGILGGGFNTNFPSPPPNTFNSIIRRTSIRNKYKIIQGSDSSGVNQAWFWIFKNDQLIQLIDNSNIIPSPAAIDAAISLTGKYIVQASDNNVFLYQGQ